MTMIMKTTLVRMSAMSNDFSMRLHRNGSSSWSKNYKYSYCGSECNSSNSMSMSIDDYDCSYSWETEVYRST